MRSLVRNHVDEFLMILSYDKTEWKKFWERMRKRFSPLLDSFEVNFDLVRRMDLDKFRRYWEKNGGEFKKKLAYELRSRSEELQLRKEDFVVFLISADGEEILRVVDGKKERVILIDVFAAWRKGEIEKLHEVIIETVKKMREG